jgi:hypothetical protein
VEGTTITVMENRSIYVDRDTVGTLKEPTKSLMENESQLCLMTGPGVIVTNIDPPLEKQPQ